MLEALVGLAAFGILSVIVWYVDTLKRARDYYDGDI